MNYMIVNADALDWAAGYEGEPFMACLCDPPYHLKGGFMSKDWDKDGPDAIAFQPETWAAIADHLYPGAFLMAFGGSRTHHRMAIAMEDAGLVLHPTMVWLNGQSFPKATRIDTQIDKAAGAEREVVRHHIQSQTKPNDRPGAVLNEDTTGWINNWDITAPATPLAATWAGHRYGLQALKPCAEFILCAQKPYSGRPVDSIVATGAGALNIDGARVATGDNLNGGCYANDKNKAGGIYGKLDYECGEFKQPAGRWPPNVTLSHIPPHPCPACDGDGCPDCGGTGWLEGCRRVGTKRVRGGCRVTSIGQGREGNHTLGIYGAKESKVVSAYADPDGLEAVEDWICQPGCPVRELGEMSGERPSGSGIKTLKGSVIGNGNTHGRMVSGYDNPGTGGDTGTAARFYPNHDWRYEIEERLAGVTPFMYQSKASRRERDAGLESLAMEPYSSKQQNSNGRMENGAITNKRPSQTLGRNSHPTVKPIALTRWLATLLLPPPEYAPRRLLVPFGGVMSEAIGGILAGWDEVVAIEMEEEYIPIGEARCRFWAGWSERGHDDSKEILKQAAKEKKNEPELQMDLNL